MKQNRYQDKQNQSQQNQQDQSQQNSQNKKNGQQQGSRQLAGVTRLLIFYRFTA